VVGYLGLKDHNYRMDLDRKQDTENLGDEMKNNKIGGRKLE